MNKHKLKYLDLDNIEGGWAELYADIPDWIAELKKPQYEPLEKKLELEYIRQNKRDLVINANLRFVLNIARHYIVKNVDVWDLVASGNEGLIEAYDSFDSDKGVKFITWAVYQIRNKMMEYIKIHNPIQISKKGLKLLSDYTKYGSIADMKKAHPERYWQPDDKLYNKLDNYITMKYVANLDDRYPTGKLVWKIAYKQDDPVGPKEVYDIINNTEVLSDNEKLIVIGAFGLNNSDELSYTDIGKVVNVSRHTVSRALDRAIHKLSSLSPLMDLFNVIVDNSDDSVLGKEKDFNPSLDDSY